MLKVGAYLFLVAFNSVQAYSISVGGPRIAYGKIWPIHEGAERTGDTELSPVKTIWETNSFGSDLAPRDFRCPFPDGLFPVPGTCGSDYYMCASGVPTLGTCPNNNIFDPVTLQCAAEADATCNNFECPSPNGFFPITPNACSQTYFVCVSGEASLELCPGISFFDPNILNCETNAPCLGTTTNLPITESSTVITTTTPEPTFETTVATTDAATSTQNTDTTTSTSATTTVIQETTTNTNICYPNPNGLYPYPGDCTKYYACSNGIPYLQSCSPGLVFNPVTQVCDYPYNVPGCENTNSAVQV